MALHYNPRIITTGLYFYLDAGDINSYLGTGTTWYDLSGNSRTANIANGATYSTSNNGIFIFDGSNDYVTMNSAANDYAWTANGSVGSSTMCYELWYKTTDTSGLLISKPWNGSGRYNILVSPGSFSLLVGTGVFQGGDQSNSIGFPASADNNWHQLVIWASSTQMGYYLDGGVSKGTINHGLTGGVSDFGNAGLPLGIMSLYFYGEGWSGNTGFSIEGSVSIFRSYRRILSEAEVLQNYNAQKSRFNI